MDSSKCIHMKPNIQYQHNTQRLLCQAETDFVRLDMAFFFVRTGGII